MSEPKICPKCEQPGWGPTPKWVTNSKGKKYFYEVFVHPKRGRMVPHYIRSIEPSQSPQLEHSNTQMQDRLKGLKTKHSSNYFILEGKEYPRSPDGVRKLLADVLEHSN